MKIKGTTGSQGFHDTTVTTVRENKPIYVFILFCHKFLSGKSLGLKF